MHYIITYNIIIVHNISKKKIVADVLSDSMSDIG